MGYPPLVGFDRDFTRGLLWHLFTENNGGVMQSGIKDYLVPGFNSIMLFRSPAMNIRLYVTRAGEHQLDRSHEPADNTLWIHDHRFSFQCQTILGYMRNLRINPMLPIPTRFGMAHGNWGTWHGYIYGSALTAGDGQMTLKSTGLCDLSLVQTETVDTGESYAMRSDEFHRIWIPSDRLVAMLFWEFGRVPHKNTTLFSNEPLPEHPSVEGLNVKMTPDEVRRMIVEVYDAL